MNINVPLEFVYSNRSGRIIFDQAAFKSAPKNRVSVTETPVSAAITEVYASEIPQKKSK